MFYQNELSFLREVFQKNHVNTDLLDTRTYKTSVEERSFLNERGFFAHLFPLILPETVYKYTDPFDRSYRLLLLPDTEARAVLCLGPFLASPLSAQRISQIGKENGLMPQTKSYRYLVEYYTGLPVLTETNPLLVMLNTFCEKIWDNPAFLIKDIDKTAPAATPFSRSMLDIEPNDTLVNKKAIEQRYSFENEMIRAVSLGQPHAEERFRSAFSENVFEKRTEDPLRNAKNYGIIMNTLLRKAAEKGGVHPIYINETSSEFAEKIEKTSNLSAIPALMSEMFRTYCRLVRRHTLRKFSLVVQKCILMIDADLSADLSPCLLAKSQGITLGYLSAAFRKETGKTLSEYIRERRMEYAEYLLNSTNLQIQTLALHCGIMDAQYFSKLFKKIIGKTPSQYRRSPAKNTK